MSLEHPFAQYVRILGKGKTGSRSLALDEARAAMAMILKDEVEDVQLGAFLMLLRVKEESPEELAGFVTAVRESIAAPDIRVDLDWSSYAGKRRQQAWYLLSALVLADAGFRVCMHGAAGHTSGRVYSEGLLAELGIAPATRWQEVSTQLDNCNFAFLPLSHFCPGLQRMMDLRNLFGLRSPVHTLSRLINPCRAQYSMQSIFHPAYGDSHQQAAALLGQRNAAVFKGEAGEVERKPEAVCKVKTLRDGNLGEDSWDRLLEGRQNWEPEMSSEVLRRAWVEDDISEYGYQAVIGTTAIALNLLDGQLSQPLAIAKAEGIWLSRNRQRLA